MHHTPYWSVAVFLVISIAVVAAAGGHDQELVLFYAVSVFVSFLVGLLAMARLTARDGRRTLCALSVAGALVVAFTLAMNTRRVDADVSLAATSALALLLYVAWARSGRPRGIAQAVAEGEHGD